MVQLIHTFIAPLGISKTKKIAKDALKIQYIGSNRYNSACSGLQITIAVHRSYNIILYYIRLQCDIVAIISYLQSYIYNGCDADAI